MNNIKTEFSACIITGGSALRERTEKAMVFYSPESSYFDGLLEKEGRAFDESACGFLLLDGLLQKNRIQRAELILLRGDNGRPYIANHAGVDFSISHSESCAMCCVALGDGAMAGTVGCDVQHDTGWPEERMLALSEQFMDEEEHAAFYYAKDKSKEFHTAWARREAYVKRIGGSIVEDIHNVIRGEKFTDGVIILRGEKYYYSINTADAANVARSEPD